MARHALYWLTSDAALVLGKAHEPATDLNTFHSAMETLEGLVKVTTEKDERHTYRMDLAARAAIQDRWRAKDPRGRAEAHRLIASRLLKNMNDKELLGVEFPIEPHWGRSRMHFLAEAIRHLVRTCDHVERPQATGAPPKEGAETFPECTTDEFSGCDPFEVINYCFGVLYWRDLNDNGKGKHHSSRKLALRHGAYHLTGELLQLMSENQEIGRPHWALNEVYISRYLREVAYSQLDLGDLSGAKATFKSLIARARTEGQDPLDVIDYQLDLIVVLASMDLDLSEAETTLADARDQFASIVHSGTEDSVRLALQIQTRIRARQAHLAYLRADYQEALEHCTYIEEKMPAALVRDVAHTYISTLGAMSDDKRNLEKAINICVRQLFDNTSRGLHHEALGFRVALGHAFRKLEMLQAAEAVLDGGYEDILQYGCAERTYLGMLLEAGRVLNDQGRLARAYAAYLRPCFERAKARGYARVAEHARAHARRCIEQLLDEVPEDGWSAEEMERRLRGRGEYLLVKKSKKVDPRSSFDPVAIERWAPRLRNRSVLQRELEAFADD
jgi:tetratricopeptide (TPR) repeat protein